MNNNDDFNFEELLDQLRSMLSPGDTDSSPLASAPTVIREAASHDFAQYRFLFPPSTGPAPDESESSDESESGAGEPFYRLSPEGEKQIWGLTGGENPPITVARDSTRREGLAERGSLPRFPIDLAPEEGEGDG